MSQIEEANELIKSLAEGHSHYQVAREYMDKYQPSKERLLFNKLNSLQKFMEENPALKLPHGRMVEKIKELAILTHGLDELYGKIVMGHGDTLSADDARESILEMIKDVRTEYSND